MPPPRPGPRSLRSAIAQGVHGGDQGQLRARTADPSVAARAILALAAVLEESVATNVVYLEPTPLRPFVEGVWRAAA